MRRSAKAGTCAALFVLWGFTVWLGFEVGGRLGFAVGATRTSSWDSIEKGIAAYQNLQRLPPEAGSELRSSLERDIDFALVDSLILVDREPSRFDRSPLPLDPCAKLPALAAHRASSPSPSSDPEWLDLVDQAVSQLRVLEVSVTAPGKCPKRPAA